MRHPCMPAPVFAADSAAQSALWDIGLPVLLGFVAIYFLLPRPRRYPPLLGSVAGALALVFAGWFLVRAGVAFTETLLFYVFSAIAVLSGGLMVTQRNPVRAALSFALVVLSTCGLFLLQAAPFLMAATIIVYAGGIIVTFLFLIMLAQQVGLSDADLRSREPGLACTAGFVLLAAILFVLQGAYDVGETPDLTDPATLAGQIHPPLPADNVAALGRMLFTHYLVAVELGGTLLLVATIGAIAITHRHMEGAR